MRWKVTTDENINTLRRIVALLLALAGDAEHAAGRSAAVRMAILWFLWPAELVARDHVEAVTGTACAPVWRSGPGEAMRLASVFRALAAVLAAFVAAQPVPAAIPRPRREDVAARSGASVAAPRRDSS